MFERPPNGFFVRDLIVFNHLRRGGYVAKGFVFEAPDLTNSQVADLNDFQDQLCLLLASLHENQRLQVQYFCDSDYKAELLRYQAGDGEVCKCLDETLPQRTVRALLAGDVRTQTPPAARHLLHLALAGKCARNRFQSDAAWREYYHDAARPAWKPSSTTSTSCLLEIFGQRRRAHPAHDRPRPFPALQNVSQSVAGRPFRLRPGGRF